MVVIFQWDKLTLVVMMIIDHGNHVDDFEVESGGDDPGGGEGQGGGAEGGQG